MRVILCLLLLLSPLALIAEEININDTGITFTAPEEFTPLPQLMIDIKFPKKSPPRWVIGNESASTTIAFDVKPNDISGVSLPELSEYFKGALEQIIPGVEWKKLEIIELAGQEWIYLEMTSSAEDTDIHNMMVVTGIEKEMVLFNFNSTTQEFPKYEAKLRESLQTIKLP